VKIRTAWGDSRRPDLRQVVYESHRIFYRIRQDEIAILSARHTRMRPENGQVT